jgi:hypothetical protein
VLGFNQAIQFWKVGELYRKRISAIPPGYLYLLPGNFDYVTVRISGVLQSAEKLVLWAL